MPDANALNEWRTLMFITSAFGATLGLFYPLILAIFKKLGGIIDDALGLNRLTRRIRRQAGPGLRALVVVVVAYLFLGTILGLLIAAFGFAVLLGNDANQKAVYATGVVAFFTAFTSGFTGASLVEEPIKIIGKNT